ncbi:hypothetical protein [Nonomuraea aurantiaca]|uniref:hypothetical protein n=1 Tax=Nonomuraea aurantiaca TaxID=2878562 RepID=UPI001CD989C3|nr:hypothetical protein [Nonomuraea aurantiaca]MCA2221360.1 hypothetical protein [Nonomuraea aurantiaca]
MGIALAAAAVVLGVAVWWARRVFISGSVGSSDPVAAGHGAGWAARLDEEAATALLEGLRAYADAGNAVDMGGERGVLTVFEPPRLISLDLLAGRFAARGPEAMHDPQTTVGALLAGFLAVEEPGVLHLRPGWADGEGFAARVRAIVRSEIAVPDGGALGVLGIAVPGDDGRPGTTLLLDLARIRDQYDESRARQPGAPDEVVLRSVLTSAIANGGPGLTWTVPPTERQLGNALATVGLPERRAAPAVKQAADH